MRMITLTSLTLLFAAGDFTGGALAADVAVPAEKCDAAWSMASPNGDAIAKDTTVAFVLDFTMVDFEQGRRGRRRRVQQGVLGRRGQS